MSRDIDIIEVSANDAQLLQAIGRLRLAVWEREGAVDADMLRHGVWLDRFDETARHWIARSADGSVVAAARSTIHDNVFDAPDGFVWKDVNRTLSGPVVNISKLIVLPAFRGRGIASRMNDVRVEAALMAGARFVTVTASAANTKLLLRSGFYDTGIVIQFPDRPGTDFFALEKPLEGT